MVSLKNTNWIEDYFIRTFLSLVAYTIEEIGYVYNHYTTLQYQYTRYLQHDSSRVITRFQFNSLQSETVISRESYNISSFISKFYYVGLSIEYSINR